jgi:hypothetical protein
MNQPEAMMSLFRDCSIFAVKNQQTVGEKNDYYITLEQLDALIHPFVEWTPAPEGE